MHSSGHDREDFAAAFEAAFTELRTGVKHACAGEEVSPSTVAAAIRAAFFFALTEPLAARALTVESLTGGEAGFGRYDRMLEYFADTLRPMREDVSADRWLPEITEKALVSGVASLIAKCLDSERQGELGGLTTEAIQFVLTPYLGGAEARKIAMRHGI